jgi:hypothetical protein
MKRKKNILSPPKFPNEDGDDKIKLKQFLQIAPDVVHNMPREEERYGKWIGLCLAILFWFCVAVFCRSDRPVNQAPDTFNHINHDMAP